MNQEQRNKAEKLFNEYQGHNINENDLNKADKKASNLGSKMGDFKLLLKMMKDVMSGKYSVSGKEKAILIGAIVYVVSPIDAIPDVIPVVGWLDDIGVVGYAMVSLSNTIQRYKMTLGIN